MAYGVAGQEDQIIVEHRDSGNNRGMVTTIVWNRFDAFTAHLSHQLWFTQHTTHSQQKFWTKVFMNYIHICISIPGWFRLNTLLKKTVLLFIRKQQKQEI